MNCASCISCISCILPAFPRWNLWMRFRRIRKNLRNLRLSFGDKCLGLSLRVRRSNLEGISGQATQSHPRQDRGKDSSPTAPGLWERIPIRDSVPCPISVAFTCVHLWFHPFRIRVHSRACRCETDEAIAVPFRPHQRPSAFISGLGPADGRKSRDLSAIPVVKKGQRLGPGNLTNW
jgi:hypothetical protein